MTSSRETLKAFSNNGIKMTENKNLQNAEFDKIIEGLKAKYKGYPLYQLTDPSTGETLIIRGSNWDEFSLIANVKAGKENRVPLNMVKTYVVYPEVEEMDLEYNKSGNWQPGRIIALAEQIQEVLGYNKSYTVKKL